MLDRRRSPLWITLALFALFASHTALAQNPGRIVFKVVDGAGEPLKGVKITITGLDTTYEKEYETNKKGRVTIGVADATRPYSFKFEYEGIRPYETPLDIPVGGALQRTITLEKGGTPSAGDEVADAAEGRLTFTPAQRAFNEGVEAIRAEDFTLAEERLRTSIARDADLSDAWGALALVLLERGEHQEALEAAQKQVELDPENPMAYRSLYDAHTALGNAGKAEAALAKLKEIGGGDTAAILYNEGVAALRLGDDAGAEQRFQEALEVDPELEPAVAALAVVYANRGAWAEAVATAERHLLLSPGEQRSLRIRYDAYRELGDDAKAKEAFAALAEADPAALTEQFFESGKASFEAGDATAAREAFEKILAIDADHAQAHYYLGLIYAAESPAKAREHLERFLAIEPDHPEAGAARQMLEYLG